MNKFRLNSTAIPSLRCEILAMTTWSISKSLVANMDWRRWGWSKEVRYSTDWSDGLAEDDALISRSRSVIALTMTSMAEHTGCESAGSGLNRSLTYALAVLHRTESTSRSGTPARWSST